MRYATDIPGKASVEMTGPQIAQLGMMRGQGLSQDAMAVRLGKSNRWVQSAFSALDKGLIPVGARTVALPGQVMISQAAFDLLLAQTAPDQSAAARARAAVKKAGALLDLLILEDARAHGEVSPTGRGRI